MMVVLQFENVESVFSENDIMYACAFDQYEHCDENELTKVTD